MEIFTKKGVVRSTASERILNAMSKQPGEYGKFEAMTVFRTDELAKFGELFQDWRVLSLRQQFTKEVMHRKGSNDTPPYYENEWFRIRSKISSRAYGTMVHELPFRFGDCVDATLAVEAKIREDTNDWAQKKVQPAVVKVVSLTMRNPDGNLEVSIEAMGRESRPLSRKFCPDMNKRALLMLVRARRKIKQTFADMDIFSVKDNEALSRKLPSGSSLVVKESDLKLVSLPTCVSFAPKALEDKKMPKKLRKKAKKK